MSVDKGNGRWGLTGLPVTALKGFLARTKLANNADNPTDIFTEPRVGYRMPKGEASEPAQPSA